MKNYVTLLIAAITVESLSWLQVGQVIFEAISSNMTFEELWTETLKLQTYNKSMQDACTRKYRAYKLLSLILSDSIDDFIAQLKLCNKSLSYSVLASCLAYYEELLLDTVHGLIKIEFLIAELKNCLNLTQTITSSNLATIKNKIDIKFMSESDKNKKIETDKEKEIEKINQNIKKLEAQLKTLTPPATVPAAEVPMPTELLVVKKDVPTIQTYTDQIIGAINTLDRVQITQPMIDSIQAAINALQADITTPVVSKKSKKQAA